MGHKVAVLRQGTGCARGNEEETGPGRCATRSGLLSTASFYPAGYVVPYLTVFSENSIDVFDVRKAEWVQTVPLKKVRAALTGVSWNIAPWTKRLRVQFRVEAHTQVVGLVPYGACTRGSQ